MEILDEPVVIQKLSHNFVNVIPDVDELFVTDNKVGYINTINSFCKRIDELADKYYDPSNKEGEIHTWSVFKGDCLEVFVEYIIKTTGHDNRIGIYGYKPVQQDDYGVDGFGIGENKNPATVQVKYRTGDYILETNKDHLTNFTSHSYINHDVSPKDKKNMLIVTTARGISYRADESGFTSVVRILNRDNLREMYDNRPMFWKGFWESMKKSRVEKTKEAPKQLREHQQEAITAIFG